MASQGTIQEFVSLMGANMSTGQPFLSKHNLYGIVQKLYPSTLTDWDTNELQKESEDWSNPMMAGMNIGGKTP
jgi:galactitol-specific phosphotransferase system IIC component